MLKVTKWIRRHFFFFNLHYIGCGRQMIYSVSDWLFFLRRGGFLCFVYEIRVKRWQPATCCISRDNLTAFYISTCHGTELVADVWSLQNVQLSPRSLTDKLKGHLCTGHSDIGHRNMPLFCLNSCAIINKHGCTLW